VSERTLLAGDALVGADHLANAGVVQQGLLRHLFELVGDAVDASESKKMVKLVQDERIDETIALYSPSWRLYSSLSRRLGLDYSFGFVLRLRNVQRGLQTLSLGIALGSHISVQQMANCELLRVAYRVPSSISPVDTRDWAHIPEQPMLFRSAQ
jgi:hypothetical protein